MTARNISRGLLALSLAAGLGLAAPAWPGEARRDTLAVVNDTWDTLQQQARIEQMGQLMAEDFVLITPDGHAKRKLDYLMSLVARPFLGGAVVNEEVATRFHGDTAIITSLNVQSGTRDGAPWSERQRVTRVWHWDGGAWLLLSSQATRLPDDYYGVKS